jgi:pilus assembly protein CpaB
MKVTTLVLLLAAVLVGSLAAYLARAIIMARPAESQTTLVVAEAPLGFGTELTADNVTEIPWASSATPAGAFTSKEALFKGGRRVALSPVEINEPILASRVTGPGEKGGLSALIDPAMRAVTVRVDDVRGVGGFVTPGDRVDVILTRKAQQQPGAASNSSDYADLLLQDVKVLGVDQLANASEEKAAVAKAVTLEVTPEQAQKLVLAQGVGTLALDLRKAGSAATVGTRRVTGLDLGEGEVATAETRKAPEADPPPTVSAPQSSTVHVLRGVTEQDYNVYHEL